MTDYFGEEFDDGFSRITGIKPEMSQSLMFARIDIKPGLTANDFTNAENLADLMSDENLKKFKDIFEKKIKARAEALIKEEPSLGIELAMRSGMIIESIDKYYEESHARACERHDMSDGTSICLAWNAKGKNRKFYVDNDHPFTTSTDLDKELSSVMDASVREAFPQLVAAMEKKLDSELRKAKKASK